MTMGDMRKLRDLISIILAACKNRSIDASFSIHEYTHGVTLAISFQKRDCCREEKPKEVTHD